MQLASLSRSSPALVQVLARESVASEATADRTAPTGLWPRLAAIASTIGERTAFSYRDGQTWRSITYREVADRARALASYFIESGIVPGDRIALLSRSRPEWCIGFFAVLGAGAVVVPLDIKLSVAELGPIVRDAEPRILLVSNDMQDVATALETDCRSIDQVIALANKGDRYPSYRAMLAETAHTMREHAPGDLAVLTYTSGTTGEPKGVMTTLGNLVHQVDAINEQFEVGPGDRFVSILPLNHLFELTGGLLMPLVHGAKVAYVDSLFPAEILDAMKIHAVTRMVVVPLFLKLIKKQIEKKLAALGRLRRAMFWAFFHLLAVLPFRALKQLVFGEIHRNFGGSMRQFVCGGAAIDVETLRFFHRLGLPIMQGYGLTETSPVATANSEKWARLGSVGRPLRDVQVEIREETPGSGEGEIVIRGPNRMKGYYRRLDLTREAIDGEGWLHTGDRGRIDADGFLYITGRIKNLIVLASGKNVQPEEVEVALESPLFDDVSVVGAVLAGDSARDGCEEVCAVVVPSEAFAASHEGSALEDAARDEIARLARAIADYKRPTRVFVSRKPLPKTATQKVKRQALAEWIQSQLGDRT